MSTRCAPSQAMNIVPAAVQFKSRDNATSIAEGYPEELKSGSFVTADTQLAADAYGFGNGRRMAGPDCTFQPPGWENMKAQRIPTLFGITYRVVAVDEELCLVLLRLDFGPGERWLHAWEAFKVDGGEIHAAEAFMRAMPAHTPSGWQCACAHSLPWAKMTAELYIRGNATGSNTSNTH